MKKWRLGLDVDQVLINSTPSFVSTNNHFFGTHITEEEYTDCWSKTRWRTGYSEAEWMQKQGIEWQNHAKKIRFYKNLPAVPGTKEALETFTKLGAEFVIVTDRRAEFKTDTLSNLKNLFPNTDFRAENCFFTGVYDGKKVSSKQGTKSTKGAVAAKLGLSMFIDDHPGHVLSALDHSVPSLWFGQHPEEKLCPDEAIGLYRGQSWEETTQIIRRALGL